MYWMCWIMCLCATDIEHKLCRIWYLCAIDIEHKLCRVGKCDIVRQRPATVDPFEEDVDRRIKRLEPLSTNLNSKRGYGSTQEICRYAARARCARPFQISQQDQPGSLRSQWMHWHHRAEYKSVRILRSCKDNMSMHDWNQAATADRDRPTNGRKERNCFCVNTFFLPALTEGVFLVGIIPFGIESYSIRFLLCSLCVLNSFSWEQMSSGSLTISGTLWSIGCCWIRTARIRAFQFN